MGIVTLSETRLANEGQFAELSGASTFSGVVEGENVKGSLVWLLPLKLPLLLDWKNFLVE